MTDSCRAGKDNERALVTWARAHGYPHADRQIRTGAGRNYAHRPDTGDVTLCPGVIAQVKSLQPTTRAERMIPTWLKETEAQRAAAHADLALLVVRRHRTTNVGTWWTHLYLHTALVWLFGETRVPSYANDIPVRLTLAHTVQLLRANGWGEPPDPEPVTAPYQPFPVPAIDVHLPASEGPQ